jgi:DNA ligase-1
MSVLGTEVKKECIDVISSWTPFVLTESQFDLLFCDEDDLLNDIASWSPSDTEVRERMMDVVAYSLLGRSWPTYGEAVGDQFSIDLIRAGKEQGYQIEGEEQQPVPTPQEDVKNSWDVVKLLESDNSRLFKEDVIKKQALESNTEFFNGVKLALDSMITFGIKQVEPKTGNGRGLSWNAFKQLTDALSARQLTGNAAINAVAHARMNATEDQWNYWYRRILIKDLRCGVSEKTVNKAVKKHPEYSVPVFSCQLAHDSANHESKVCGQKLLEVKLDGVRVITVVYPNGQVDQYSRNGKELVNFELIKKQISKHAIFFSEPVVLDGEVMSANFQDLMKQVNRKENVKTDDAVLNLFDIITLQEFQNGKGNFRQIDRSVSLLAWYNQCAEHMPNVDVVGQELVDLDTDRGQLRFKEINQTAIDGGYEGIMLKDPEAVYICDRSVAWLKLKPFIEVTLEVIDVEQGTGRNEGRLGALVCKGIDDSKEILVNVGSGFSDQLRSSIWQSRSKVIGHLVEVRADAITQNQDGTYSLRFPRFKSFRGFLPGEKL